MAGGLRGLACRQILRRRPLTSLEELWRVQTPGTHLRGLAPPHGRRRRRHLEVGKRTRRVYTEGILPWVWPRCCSRVFLWADLRQPGGYVHCSKPVHAQSKGYIPWSNTTGLGGTGALEGSNATGASHRALIHAGWCGGMFEEVGRVSGAWPPSRTAMTR